jgi:hypothetical protein
MNNIYPRKGNIRFILAEEVRPELMGKLSLQGFMPGEQFRVIGQPPPNLPPGIAFLVPSLAFVFAITGGRGKFVGRFRVIAPDKKTILMDVPAEKPIEARTDKISVFVMGARPFFGPAFGTYSVRLDLDDTKYVFPMSVEKGDVKIVAGRSGAAAKKTPRSSSKVRGSAAA